MPKKIMIVDDEALMRNLLKIALTNAGFDVVQVDDGVRSLEAAKKEKPTLIVMDINMPGMSGIDAIKLLKKEPQTAHIPIMVMTAYATHENILEAIKAGAVDAATKAQVRIENFIQKIETIIKKDEEKNRINKALKSVEAQYKVNKETVVTKKTFEKVKDHREKNKIKKRAVFGKVMSQSAFDAKIHSITDIKTLPFVAQRVARIAGSSGTDTHLLVTELQRDPVLSAKVLRLANSAYYATSDNVISLERAVLTIGRQGISDLASSIAVLDQFFDSDNKGILNRIQFWEHCFCCGAYAKRIAQLAKYKEPELLFLSGLFHSLGVVVFDDFFHKEFSMILEQYTQHGGRLIDWEKKVIGHDHNEAGGKVLQAWGLSPQIIEPTQLYNNPIKSLDLMPDTTNILRLANILAETHGYSIGVDDSIYFVPMKMLKKLGLQPANLEVMSMHVDKDMLDLRMVFFSYDISTAQKHYNKTEYQNLDGKFIELYTENMFALDPIELSLKSKNVDIDKYDSFDLPQLVREMTADGIIIEIMTQSFLNEFINQLKQISEKGWHDKVPLVVFISEQLTASAKKSIPEVKGITLLYEPFSVAQILSGIATDE